MANDDRLEQLRQRIGNVPRRVQRSVDRVRRAYGMPPLWPKTDSRGSSRRTA